MIVYDIVLGLACLSSAYFSAFVVIHGLISVLLAIIHSCSSPTKSKLHRTKAIIRLFPVVIFLLFPLFIDSDTDPYEVIRYIVCGIISLIAYFISFFVIQEIVPKDKNEHPDWP